MPTILITGAASGLGAAFLQHYSQDPTNKIIAIDRQTIPPASRKANIESYTVDISSQTSINTLTTQLNNQAIDLVIHSAGIRGLVPQMELQHPNNVHACETLDVMDFSTLMNTFQTNAVGTFMLLKAILPNLQASQSLPKVIIMSSRMGSIGNNQHPNKDAGSAYAYRASKAALNIIVRSFAADTPGVCFVLCHPGRVETNLVKVTEAGAIPVQESVRGLIPLIEGWGKEDSGKFYDRFGERIAW